MILITHTPTGSVYMVLVWNGARKKKIAHISAMVRAKLTKFGDPINCLCSQQSIFDGR